MNKIVSAVHDQQRNILFRVGDRIHWYEYSADTIIMNGGYGLIIAIEKRVWSEEDIPFLRVMKDGGCEMAEFPVHDCDLEENWDDGNSAF